jgi:hypothetical protein
MARHAPEEPDHDVGPVILGILVRGWYFTRNTPPLITACPSGFADEWKISP